MKNKWLFLLVVSFLLSVTMVACSNSSSNENGDAETNGEVNDESEGNGENVGSESETNDDESNSVDESSSEETSKLSEEEALSLVKDVNESLLSTAKNDDLDAFAAFYDASLDESVVLADFDYFKSTVGSHEDLDIGLMFHTEDVIGASFFEYTNLTAESGKLNHSNRSYKLFLEEINGEWVYSASDKVNEAYNSVFIPSLHDKYGKEFIENGFTSASHSYIFDKVLTNNIEVELYKMKLNDDNSLDVVIAIQNGYDNDIYNVSFNKLLIGNDEETIFADLAGLALDTTDIIKSKNIGYYETTIPPEDLLLQPSEISMVMHMFQVI